MKTGLKISLFPGDCKWMGEFLLGPERRIIYKQGSVDARLQHIVIKSPLRHEAQAVLKLNWDGNALGSGRASEIVCLWKASSCFLFIFSCWMTDSFPLRDKMFMFLAWCRHVEVESSWTLSQKGLGDTVKFSLEVQCAYGKRQLFVKIAVFILVCMSSS